LLPSRRARPLPGGAARRQYILIVRDVIYGEDLSRARGGPKQAVATPAAGEERERLWAMLKENYPFFADHEASTERVIPVVTLTRA
jgi:F420H(2)-dependent quinone reductase